MIRRLSAEERGKCVGLCGDSGPREELLVQEREASVKAKRPLRPIRVDGGVARVWLG